MSQLSCYTHLGIITSFIQWENGKSEPETENLMNFFFRTVTNTQLENRVLIWEYLSEIAMLASNVCSVWNAKENPWSVKYQSCNFFDPCILSKRLKNMKSNVAKRDQYMAEMQNIYYENFTPFSAFVLALNADSKNHKSSSSKITILKSLEKIYETFHMFVFALTADLQTHQNLTLLQTLEKRIEKLKSLEKTCDNLQSSSRNSDVALEVEEVYNIVIGYTISYSECLNHYPTLMNHEKVNPYPRTRADWIGNGLMPNTESNDVPLMAVLKRMLIRLSLLFSLNNFIVNFCNSNIASLIQCFISHIAIILIFFSCPIVPFSIAFTVELLANYVYRKSSGCVCQIQKNFPMLKIIKNSKMSLRRRFIMKNSKMYKN